MALWTTYDEVGVKEDVSDVISNISPTKTPFQASIGSEKCTQKLFEWQEDSLRAVAENAQVEGFTASDVALTATTMRSNLTQIMAETIKVAGTPDASDAYGRAKESAYQLSKSMASVKRDLEYAYVGSAQAKVTPANNLTARKMAGFQAQLLNGGSAALDSDDFVLYTGGTSTVPTEANFLSVMQHLYDQGADSPTVQVTPTNSRTVADFMKTASSLRERDFGSSKTLVNVVDVYVSPFGKHSIVLNRFLKAKNTLFYDVDMWKKVTLRPWTRETLAKTGDNTSIMIVGEFSLKHKNFKASAAIVEAAGPTGF
jgi:hypothetical protein